MKSNPSYFYKYAKKSSKGSNQIGTSVGPDGKLCKNHFEKSECFRKQYESVFTKPREDFLIKDPLKFFNIQKDELKCQECSEEMTHMCNSDPAHQEDEIPLTMLQHEGHPAWPWGEQELEQEEGQEQEQEQETPTISDIFIDYEDVVEAIRKIPNGSSPGPDGVLSFLMKRAETSIALMLVNVFQASFDTGEIPDILKLGLVCPIHKCGSASETANFRPVSLTSHVMKTEERIVRKKLVNHLDMINKMDACQHGSKQGRSTHSQLLEHHAEIIKMVTTSTAFIWILPALLINVI